MNWKKQFKDEFGIHFKKSPDELTFAITFIEELLDQQKTEIDSIITERMKQIANIPFYKRKNSYDELKELRKKLKNKK
jgi:hypothetical protein